MQFDNLFPRFPPKYQQIEEDRGLFKSCLKLSVTYIFMQIIKKQLYVTILSNEKDRIKILETADFTTKRRDQQEI